MRVNDIKRISNASFSLGLRTRLTVWCRRWVAALDRLNSPHQSRWLATYHNGDPDLPEGAVGFTNGTEALVVAPPDTDEAQILRAEVLQNPPEETPYEGQAFVALVPTSLVCVRHVVRTLVRERALPEEAIAPFHGDLALAATFRRLYAGTWTNGDRTVPVWFLRKELIPAWDELGGQGNLRLYAGAEGSYALLAGLSITDFPVRVLDHVLSRPGDEGEPGVQPPLGAFALDAGSVWAWSLLVWGHDPIVITHPVHQDASVPVEAGSRIWVTHRVPRMGRPD